MGRDRRPPADPQWGRYLRGEGRCAHVALGRQPPDHARAAIEVLVRPGDPQAQGDRLGQAEPRLRSGAPMTDYREADFSRLKTVPIAQRPNKIDASLLAQPPGGDASFTAFWDSLPDILAAQDLRTVARQLAAAAGRRGVVVMLGGHVIKVGLGPLLRELVRRGVITHLALNGSAAIHDFELAAYGGTSEDVAAGLADGTFGMVEETGREMNAAIADGARAGKGMGEALADYLARRPQLAARDVSLLLAAAERAVPVTVHATLGADIIHQHPAADGAALGATSHRDFRRHHPPASRGGWRRARRHEPPRLQATRRVAPRAPRRRRRPQCRQRGGDARGVPQGPHHRAQPGRRQADRIHGLRLRHAASLPAAGERCGTSDARRGDWDPAHRTPRDS